MTVEELDKEVRQRLAMPYEKRVLYARIETTHIAISKCMRQSHNGNEKGRVDARDTAAVNDIL